MELMSATGLIRKMPWTGTIRSNTTIWRMFSRMPMIRVPLKLRAWSSIPLCRRNLVNKVHAGFFNDNVGFWFDNMSQGWLTEENNLLRSGAGGDEILRGTAGETILTATILKLKARYMLLKPLSTANLSFQYDKLTIASSGQPSGSYPAA